MQRNRALHYLTVIRRDIGRLTALEGSWFDDDFLPDDRTGYRAEWANSLDRFSAIVRAGADRQLDDDVADQVIDVARLLASMSRSLDRMRLRPPSSEDLVAWAFRQPPDASNSVISPCCQSGSRRSTAPPFRLAFH